MYVTCVCTYVRIYGYVYIYMYMHVSMCTWVHVCLYIRMCARRYIQWSYIWIYQWYDISLHRPTVISSIMLYSTESYVYRSPRKIWPVHCYCRLRLVHCLGFWNLPAFTDDVVSWLSMCSYFTSATTRKKFSNSEAGGSTLCRNLVAELLTCMEQ